MALKLRCVRNRSLHTHGVELMRYVLLYCLSWVGLKKVTRLANLQLLMIYLMDSESVCSALLIIKKTRAQDVGYTTYSG